MNDDDVFLELVATLSAALPDLWSRSADDPCSPRLRVVYDPTKECAETGEILIGLGFAQAVAGETVDQSGVVLQNKGSAYRSLSALLQHVADDQIDHWWHCLGQPATPADLQATLYVEDASPDTCLGLVLFLARVFGVSQAALPTLWCNYADRWEQGDVRTTGQPFASWGCLHSALAHDFIAPQSGAAPDAQGIETAFPICLRYLLGLLTLGVIPDQVPEILPLEEHHAARLYLRQEYQDYLHTLTSAECLQLRVPLPGERRALLVDAYLTTEVMPSGTRKAFLRNDTEHPWFGQGFTLMALYRPLAEGSGDDLVISVDPSAGVYLRALWQALERLEDERWDDERPRDRPRELKSYQVETIGDDGVTQEISYVGPNQPWYDEQGRYTLVAAPKRLADGRLGSRVTWQDVREQLWACYNPAQTLRFIPYDDPTGTDALPESVRPSLPLHRCPASRDTVGEKRLRVVGWDAGNSEPLALTPTLERYLAACAEAEHPAGVPLDALPDPRSFDFLKLLGGFAVVHGHGVLLIDDWCNERLNVDGCRQEFDQVAARLRSVHEIGAEAMALVERLQHGLAQGRPLPYRDLVWRLPNLRLRLRTTLFRTRAASEDSDVLHFRETLEHRWGLAGQLAELNETLEQLDTLAQNQVELRTNRLLNGLTIYGFPAALFTEFFGNFVLQKWSETGSWVDGVHWHGLLLYLALCGTGSLLLWLLNRSIHRFGGRGRQPKASGS